MQAGMEAWMNWAAKAGDAVVDLGAPLGPGTVLGGGSSESDISGFSILEAESLDAVTNVLTGHPHLEWGGTIEVLAFLAMPGMG